MNTIKYLNRTTWGRFLLAFPLMVMLVLFLAVAR